jgi:hypothetical protein
MVTEGEIKKQISNIATGNGHIAQSLKRAEWRGLVIKWAKELARWANTPSDDGPETMKLS